MRKAYMGMRLRRLREERSLKQIELANALGISPSYLNQLEQNQRPLTVPVLLKLNAAFGVDVQLFSEDEEGRLITELRELLSQDGQETVSLAEIRELATGMPAVGRTLVSLHRRYRDSLESNQAMAAQLGDDWIAGGPPRMPFEQVRDFFYTRHNHVALLDEAAERLYHRANLAPRTVHAGRHTRWAARRVGANGR
jgi:transcriptional regulator with XRE-family HTH domain